jgi:DNA-binding beta-propeller fold protein YncE
VADRTNHLIRKITPAGAVSTLAGSGSSGSADGSGMAASFYYPQGVVLDDLGQLVVADYFNHRIRKITPTGVVSTLAGSSAGSADGTGTGASFYYPAGLAIDASGQIYVADLYNNRIRKITPIP